MISLYGSFELEKKLPYICPCTPQQPNGIDCGLYDIRNLSLIFNYSLCEEQDSNILLAAINRKYINISNAYQHNDIEQDHINAVIDMLNYADRYRAKFPENYPNVHNSINIW